jgi:hypothetical protein
MVAWFEEWHERQDGDICICIDEAERNVSMRNETEQDWFYKFFVLVGMPCIEWVLLAFSMIFSPTKDVPFHGMEFGYSIFYARQMYKVLDAACCLSVDAKKFRHEMMNQLARGKASFTDVSGLQQGAFLGWLTEAYKGFTILGIEVSPYVSIQMGSIALGAFVPTVYRAFQHVLPVLERFSQSQQLSGFLFFWLSVTTLN